MKRIWALTIGILCTALLLSGCTMFWELQEQIDSIGTVTIQSGRAIRSAEQMLEDTPQWQLALVDNLDDLSRARAEFDRIKKLVDDAEDTIAAVTGKTITHTDGELIKKAWAAVDELEKEGLADEVQEQIPLLEQAEQDYEQACEKEEIRQKYLVARSPMERGAYEEAMDSLQDFIDAYPDSAHVRDAEDDYNTCLDHVNNDKLHWAQRLFDEGNFAAAWDHLQSIDKRKPDGYYVLAEKIGEKAAALRPQTGTIFHRSVASGYGAITVKSEMDAWIKMTNVENGQSVIFFVRAGEKFAVTVCDGDYYLDYAFGTHWFGNQDKYGNSGTYRRVSGIASYSTTYSGYTVYYTTYDYELETMDSLFHDRLTAYQFWP